MKAWKLASKGYLIQDAKGYRLTDTPPKGELETSKPPITYRNGQPILPKQ